MTNTWISSFQQAVLRNANERNAQMQKQLENVVREGILNIYVWISSLICCIVIANSELSLLNTKVAGVLCPVRIPSVRGFTAWVLRLALERDLEVEKRKNRDLMDAAKDRDAEYQKIKGQLDKMKRKALLGHASWSAAAQNADPSEKLGLHLSHPVSILPSEGAGLHETLPTASRLRASLNQLGVSAGHSGQGSMGEVVSGMDANKAWAPYRFRTSCILGFRHLTTELTDSTNTYPPTYGSRRSCAWPMACKSAQL